MSGVLRSTLANIPYIALLVILVFVPAFVSNLYYIQILIFVGIYIILALSLNLLNGYVGLLFRELEYSICKDFSRRHNAIIALGGGTVRYEWNRDVLKGTGLIILLKVPLDEIIQRVQVADRPRVNIGTTLEEDVRRIWEESKEKYYNAADIIYEPYQKSIADEVEELKTIILDHLG